MSLSTWIEDLPRKAASMRTDPFHCTRRTVLRSLAGGSLLLPGILSELLAQERDTDPLAPKRPHFRARAKQVIFLNMSGGVSHVDSFDYKPRLFADHNKPYKVPQRM